MHHSEILADRAANKHLIYNPYNSFSLAKCFTHPSVSSDLLKSLFSSSLPLGERRASGEARGTIADEEGSGIKYIRDSAVTHSDFSLDSPLSGLQIDSVGRQKSNAGLLPAANLWRRGRNSLHHYAWKRLK